MRAISFHANAANSSFLSSKGLVCHRSSTLNEAMIRTFFCFQVSKNYKCVLTRFTIDGSCCGEILRREKLITTVIFWKVDFESYLRNKERTGRIVIIRKMARCVENLEARCGYNLRA